MILHLSIFGLLLILIAVIALSVREGFTVDTPTVTVSKICKDSAHVCAASETDCKSGDAYINLYGRTSSATALNVRIVYSSTNNIITGTTVSDSVLSETATVSPAPTSVTQEDSLITNVNANRLTEGKTYYIIARTNTTYTAGGSTPLLGSFIYRSADVLECPVTPASMPASAIISFTCKDDNNVRLFGHTTKSTALSTKIVYSSTSNMVQTGGVSDRVLASSVVFQPRQTLTPALLAIVPVSDLVNGKTYYIISSTAAAYNKGSTVLLGSFTYNSADLEACPAPAAPAAGRGSSSESGSSSSASTDDSKMSSDSYAALTAKQRSDLLSDVKRIMREERLRARQLKKPSSDMPSYDDECTDAMEQGREFSRRRCAQKDEDAKDDEEGEARCPTYPNGTCPPVPDMSKYIRKDAIPCWGCAVDF